MIILLSSHNIKQTLDLIIPKVQALGAVCSKNEFPMTTWFKCGRNDDVTTRTHVHTGKHVPSVRKRPRMHPL